MEQIARDPRADFLAVYSNTIKRDGAAAMIYWLDCKTDFFTAPASRKNHLAQPGGLAVHSLNVWRRLREITVRDTFPLGHGEKSLFLITRHMALTEEEALAIRWHMGAYDDAVKGGSRSMTEAMNLTSWVWRLQEADMCAAWIDERSAAE